MSIHSLVRCPSLVKKVFELKKIYSLTVSNLPILYFVEVSMLYWLKLKWDFFFILIAYVTSHDMLGSFGQAPWLICWFWWYRILILSPTQRKIIIMNHGTHNWLPFAPPLSYLFFFLALYIFEFYYLFCILYLSVSTCLVSKCATFCYSVCDLLI